jgi:hypothetical protein
MPAARLTHHELAAKLHSANGRVSRARQCSNALDRDVILTDAHAIIGEVIAELLCGETTAERFAHRTMPVIPRDGNPPTDPNL